MHQNSHTSSWDKKTRGLIVAGLSALNFNAVYRWYAHFRRPWDSIVAFERPEVQRSLSMVCAFQQAPGSECGRFERTEF